MEGDALGVLDYLGIKISIHALRMEGDRTGWGPASATHTFLSTPSAWRATHP